MKCVWFNTVLFQKPPCVSETLTGIYSSSHTCSNVSRFYLSTAHLFFLLSERLRITWFAPFYESQHKSIKGAINLFHIGIIFLPTFSFTSTPCVFCKLQLFATKFSPFSLLFPVLQWLIFMWIFHLHQCGKRDCKPPVFKKNCEVLCHYGSLPSPSHYSGPRFLATLVTWNPTFFSLRGS